LRKLAIIFIILVIIGGFIWLNLTPTVKPEYIEIKAELVKADVKNPDVADYKYALDISVDSKKKLPLSVNDKYLHTVYFYIDGFVPRKNARIYFGKKFNAGVYHSETALPVIKELKKTGIDYPVNVSGPDLEGFFYKGDLFPAKVRYHILDRQIVDPSLPGATVQNDNKPDINQCYIAYSHRETKWGRDLSWIKLFPIEDRTERSSNAQLTLDERKIVDLYLTVIKGAFEMGNGPNGFIALRHNTLEGLGEKAKIEVVRGLEELSPNVLDLEEAKLDSSKFEYDKSGDMIRAIDGTILSVELIEYNQTNALIKAGLWYGNLGAVSPEYKATYIDGKWYLELVSLTDS